MNPLQKFFQGFLNRWDALSFNQKMMVGTLLIAMALSSFFLFRQAQDDYDVLYANLSVPDAAAIVAKLKDAKAPYRVADGGTTILVPRPRKNDLVLETASELTSEQTVKLGQIPPVVQGDVQKEWIKKLNTDAIAEILRSVRGVKNAQVIVSQPEHSVFEDDAVEPSASVMLMVEPGFRFRDEQVKMIKNLVAHAVPGLKPEKVAIADNTGNSLEGVNGGMAGGLSDAEIRRKSFEDETAKKVLGILGPIVGRENAVVSVSATLNFDQSQARIKRVIPLGGTAEAPTGLAVSTQEQVETYANGTGKKPEGGAVGAESNTTAPSYGQESASDKDGKGNYQLTKRTTNFTNSEEEQNVIYASGTVQRMTVAVVLNKVLTAKETEELRESVANAAGIDFARGDSVDIKGFQFSQPPVAKDKELAEASKQAADQAFLLQIISVAAVVILGLAALVFFYVLFSRPAEGELVEEYEPSGGYLQPTNANALPDNEPLPVAVLEAKLDPEVEMMREAISNLVTQDPAEAARVLSSYMQEG